MGRSRLGTVYAQALLDLARAEGRSRAYAEEIESFREALAAQRDVRIFWESPGVGRADKIRVLRTALRGKVSDHVMNLLCVLAKRGREQSLGEICDAYATLLDEAEGLVRGTLRLAVEAPGEIVARLEGALARACARRVSLATSVDPALLGGAVAQVGDLVADGSLKTRLAHMRKRLLEAGDTV
ncbi:MAG: ATP synthase F1 subunit delta [Planctomycetes bacterium]|nr:ATP synthase F1 subunit delta [Planctomycetota bacterium]